MRWELIHPTLDGKKDPGRRMGATTWFYDGGLWLFGGRRSADEVTPRSDLWRFDLHTQAWNDFQPQGAPPAPSHCSPVGRNEAAAWVANSSLFMYGGTIDGSPCNELWQLDTGSLRWFSEQAVPSSQGSPGIRAGSVVWSDAEEYAWLFGGIGKSAKGDVAILGDLWRFSIKNRSWHEYRGSTPPPRTHASHCTSNDNCWIFGGVGAPSQWDGLRDLWSFNRRTGQTREWWNGHDTDSRLSPGAVLGAAMLADRKNVYVFGGLQGTPRKLLSDLWKFESANKSWSRLPHTKLWPSARNESCNWIDENGNLWIYGGYGVDAEGAVDVLGDFWLLACG